MSHSQQFYGDRTTWPDPADDTAEALAALPSSQQQMVYWLNRQGDTSLDDIARHLDCQVDEAREVVESLVHAGLVSPVEQGDRAESSSETVYRAQLRLPTSPPPEPDIDLPDEIGSHPLSVILSTSEHDRVVPGSQYSLGVTVANNGDRNAAIDVYLDELPPALQQWSDSTQERVALAPNHSSELVFQFDLPPSVLPAKHVFWVCVDSPQHYPHHPPLRFVRQLQVLPPIHAQSRGNDPTFYTQPSSHSLEPIPLVPGGATQFQVTVFNRSERVDRFRLSCTDLPINWYSISYPQGIQEDGLAAPDNYLDLNPGERGTILFLITPPFDALAGTFIPTLRLRSENNQTLALLDLLYLDLQPVYQLDIQFRTLLSQIRNQPGLFSIQVANQGNLSRTVEFSALPLDGGELCTYTFDPQQLTLSPKQTLASKLVVRPKHQRKRPLWGGGRLLNFCVEVNDIDRHPLPDIPMQGTVIWKARPWWQILPVVLLLIGGIATVIWLIWWLWLRPPVPVEIVRFSPNNSVFSGAAGDVVRLNFQVSQPRRIQSIEITSQSVDGQTLGSPLVFDFSQGLPDLLKPYCTYSRRQLFCQNIRTDARRPGEYIFTLRLDPKPGRNQSVETMSTSPVTITPVPLPTIQNFKSNQPVYTESLVDQDLDVSTQPETSSNGGSNSNSIHLNWVISQPERIKSLELIGRVQDGTVTSSILSLDVPALLAHNLNPNCQSQSNLLVCDNVPTHITQAGIYTFELTASLLHAAEETVVSATTDPIEIKPRPPHIETFQIDGTSAGVNYSVPVDDHQLSPSITINWKVESSPGATAELLPVPGAVPLSGAIPIPLSQEPGSTVISLKATNSVGEQVVRSVVVETYDPTPSDPDSATAGGISTATEPQGLGAPRPINPGQLTPLELPPQFKR